MSEIETIIEIARRKARDFVVNESGATAIEYAMVAAGIGAALAATISSMGSSVKTALYDKLASIFQ